MAWFWDKKRVLKEAPTDKGEDSVRIDAEDMIDQNYSCEEIAAELNITKEKVYRIKEAKKRREARLQRPGIQTQLTQDDPIQQMNVEIKRIELEMKKNELEWKMKQQQRQQAEEFNDMFGAAEEHEVEAEETPEDNFLKVLVPVLANKFLGGNQQHSIPVMTSQPIPEGNATPTAQENQHTQAQPSEVGSLTDAEAIDTASRLKSIIPKKYLHVVIDQLRMYSDADLIKIKNELVRS